MGVLARWFQPYGPRAIAGGLAGTIAGLELVLFAGGMVIVALIVGTCIVLGGAF